MQEREFLEKWRGIGHRPICEEKPAGEEVYDHACFEEIKSLIDKKNLSGQSVDWNRIVVLSADITEGKSKDLQIASALCRGLWHTDSYRGLLSGLSCLDAICRAFWQSMYPTNAARKNRQLRDLATELSAMECHPEGPGEKSLFLDCLQQLQMLNDFIKDASRGTFNFDATLDKWRTAAGVDVTDTSLPTRSASNTRELPPVISRAASDASPLTTKSSESASSLGEMWSSARLWASKVQAENSTLAWPYRVLRLSAWYDICEYPGTAEGVTRVPPPDTRLVKSLELSHSNGEWGELLQQSESSLAEFPYWLDLQFFSTAALRGLGSDYRGALGAVESEIKSFLDQFPALTEYRFSNRLPFASARTLAWLASIPSTPCKRAEAVQGGPSQNGGVNVRHFRDELAQFLVKSSVHEAVVWFERTMAGLHSAREKFDLRMEFANFCIASDALQLALGQFAALELEAQRFRLEEWDPDLYVGVLLSWWKILHSGPKGMPEKAVAAQSRWIYNRVSKLNAVKALALLA